jgi:hypothetical protein
MLSLSQKRRRLLTDKSRSHSSSPEEAKRKIFRSVSPNGETQGKIGKYRESSVFRRALLATFNSFDTDDSLEVNKVPPLICFDEEYFISYPRALMAANSFDEDEITNSTGVKIDGHVVYPEVFVGEGGKILFEI